MGYDLYNLEDESEFRWNIYAWRPLLRLATDYGWTPEGTDIPPWYSGSERKEIIARMPDYYKNYTGNDGQVITATDAVKIANALKISLNDIPDFEVDENITNTNVVISDDCSEDERLTQMAENFITNLNSNVDPLVYFSGAIQKAYIQEFIEFCEKGAFIIR